MAGGYDGSIHIDTTVDTKSFNTGIAKISSSIKGTLAAVVGSLTEVVITVGTIGLIIGAIVGALIAAAGAALYFGFNLINAMSQAISRTNAYGQQIAEIERQFANVKGAIYAAFSPLISFVAPIIQTVVNWLVNMFNTISMIIGALLGQKEVWQYVAGSADSAATSTGRLADNTGKATKAAKGALAAFDQLNVLQQNTADTSNMGGFGGGGAMKFEKKPIDKDIQKTVDFIKKPFVDAWNAITKAANDAWAWIVKEWGLFSAWFKQYVADPLMADFTLAWNWIVQEWNQAAAWFDQFVIGPLAAKFDWLGQVLAICAQQIYAAFVLPLANMFMTYLWPILQTVFALIGEGLNVMFQIFGVIWQIVVSNFQIGFATVVSIFQNVIIMFVDIIGGLITEFGGLIEFITGVFTGNWKLAWQGVKDVFKGMFEGITGIVKAVVNTVIDMINGMIKAVVTGVNTVIGALNKIQIHIPSIFGQPEYNFGVSIPKVAYTTIPRLATGAVIPPNAAFAAILGDQTHGKNLEMPEGLLDSKLDEKFQQYQNSQSITINFAGSLSSLVRELKPFIDKENVRIGDSLISGGFIG
jgi:hypothetical protein